MKGERHASVRGRQLDHLNNTLKLQPGDPLSVGLLNGQIGTGKIMSVSTDSVELEITWEAQPPPPLPLTLILGLPRPKMLKRIIQTCATMGVKRLYLINAWKVEKSYWQTPILEAASLREHCILGLEQAKDTLLPEIYQRRLFKPFVEDELASLSAESRKLLAHPGSASQCPISLNAATTLVIGPEGGFTPYEVGMFQRLGFEGVHLGPRILRVETAVPTLLGRLFCQ